MRKHTFEAYRDGYARLWDEMVIRKARANDVLAAARSVIAGKPRYVAVERITGVPWYFVGIVHKMECGLAWSKHLHNGDPLTRRTTRVPAGYPRTGAPPFTWEQSAVDALRLKSLERVGHWTVERIAYEFERFNGFGYRRFGVPSPYLWSFTTAYTSGKYVRDGVWSPSACSSQSGAMAVLRELAALEGIRIPRDGDVAAPAETVDESEILPVTPGVWALLARSKTLAGTAVATIGVAAKWTAEKVGDLSELLPDIASEADGFSGALVSIAGHLGVALAGVGVAAVLYGIVVVVYARVSASFKGKIG